MKILPNPLDKPNSSVWSPIYFTIYNKRVSIGIYVLVQSCYCNPSLYNLVYNLTYHPLEKVILNQYYE